MLNYDVLSAFHVQSQTNGDLIIDIICERKKIIAIANCHAEA